MFGMKKQTQAQKDEAQKVKGEKKISGYDKKVYFKTCWLGQYELWSKPNPFEDKTLHMVRMSDLFFNTDMDQLVRDTHDPMKSKGREDYYVIRNI